MTVCDTCAAKDVRILQDRYNRAHLLLSRVAEALGIDEDDVEKRMKAIDTWAKKEIYRKVAREPRPRVAEEIKHTKYGQSQ